jgi:putative ATP-binding cassette transporter
MLVNIINKDFRLFVTDNAGRDKRRIYFATVLNGVCMAVMMYSLAMGLDDYTANNTVSFRGVLLFGIALFVYYYSQSIGGRIVSTAVLKGLGALELRVMDKLRRASYATFKEMDLELIYAAVGGDKYSAVMAARFLIPTMSAVVVVVVVGLYLLTISVPGAITVMVSLFVIIRIRGKLDNDIFARKKDDAIAADSFTTTLSDIIDGFNELKANRRKSDALFKEKIRPASEYKNERLMVTENHQMNSLTLEQAALFVPLGFILFMLPSFFTIDSQDLIKLISVTLIAIWPAYTLVQFGPVSANAAAMIKRMSDLEERLDDASLEPEISSEADYPLAPEFDEISCEQLEYVYPVREGDKDAFVLTIDEFRIKKGELVLMRGGNGSGKSTFMRLLAGLETPTKGTFDVDDIPVAEVGESNYRALFSFVMTDFHLFDKLYGTDSVDMEQFDKWVLQLGLGEKVTDPDNLPTVALSSGQKKRMALLTSILEGRPFLLFDEVAADFDPYAREMFYREALPILKAEGRTLFVISHDDRYYDIADRVLTMSEGRIVP